MTTRSNEYWERRARQRMADYHRRGDDVILQIALAYDKGRRDIEDAIERIFGKFMRDGALDPNEAVKLLNEPISRKEWERIRDQYRKVKDPKVRRRLLNYLNAPAYRARITRLQALQADIYIQSKIIADVEIGQSSQFYMDTLNQAYYRTMFDIQKGVGYGFVFASMPSRTVQEILRRPWSGSHFSTRVWHNTDELARHVTEIVTAGMKSGVSTRKMRDELAERMNVGKHVANRLIRTETTYVANAAEQESYKEAGIEKYIFVATLDLRTSEICRNMDLKVFNVADAEPGKNLPPMHPYCRSTTIAYFSQRSLDRIQRRARDPITGETYLVPAGMNYKKWYNEFVEKPKIKHRSY